MIYLEITEWAGFVTTVLPLIYRHISNIGKCKKQTKEKESKYIISVELGGLLGRTDYMPGVTPIPTFFWISS